MGRGYDAAIGQGSGVNAVYTYATLSNLLIGMANSCVFCDIISGDSPANVRYEDEEYIVFDNKLTWAPVMMLVVKKEHMEQDEYWQDMSEAGRIAVEMGKRYCPDGFRLVSNFGDDAMQSQEHGHLHVIGGRFLGPYV